MPSLLKAAGRKIRLLQFQIRHFERQQLSRDCSRNLHYLRAADQLELLASGVEAWG